MLMRAPHGSVGSLAPPLYNRRSLANPEVDMSDSVHLVVRRCRVLTMMVLCGLGLAGCGRDERKLARADEEDPVAVAQTEPDSPRPGEPAKEWPGEDWPEFLGPRGDGTSSETGLLKKWPA